MRFTFDQFWTFTAPLEGEAAYHMYMVQDLQVATGMGITFGKSEGLGAALARTWVYKAGHPRAGSPCDRGDVIHDYNTVLGMTDEGAAGGGGRQVWLDATQCRITPDDLRKAVSDKLDTNIRNLKTRFSPYFADFDNFPADAQLAVASMTWAAGPNFPVAVPPWTKLSEACRDNRWDGDETPPKWVASKQCTFKNAVGTQITRGRYHVTLFYNSASVQAGFGQPDVLYWPSLLARGAGDYPMPASNRSLA
jgi:hypothetical protein